MRDVLGDFIYTVCPPFGSRPRGISLNEGGKYATFCALTWKETMRRTYTRRYLIRLWVLGYEVFSWMPA